MKDLLNYVRHSINKIIGHTPSSSTIAVIDLGMFKQRQLLWHSYLATVSLVFDPTFHNDFVSLQYFINVNTTFLCDSKSRLRDLISLACPPSLILFDASRLALTSHLRFAITSEVTQFIVNDLTTVSKIKKLQNNAKFILSLNLTLDRDDIAEQLDDLASIGCQMKGLKLNCSDWLNFILTQCDDFALLIEVLLSLVNHPAWSGEELILYFGDGLPSDPKSLELFATLINPFLAILDTAGWSFCATPSEFLIRPAVNLATSIVSTQCHQNLDANHIFESSIRKPKMILTVSESVYGSFAPILKTVSTSHLSPHVVSSSKRNFDLMCSTSVLGSCSEASDDVILKSCLLPSDVKVGDWLLFEAVGGSVLCSQASAVNDLSPPTCYYLNESNGGLMKGCLLEDLIPVFF